MHAVSWRLQHFNRAVLQAVDAHTYCEAGVATEIYFLNHRKKMLSKMLQEAHKREIIS